MSFIKLNDSFDTVQNEMYREKALYEDKKQFIESEYNRIWSIHKENFPIEEMKLFQRQSEELIFRLENDNLENSSPFKFAVELNKSLIATRTTYIKKFKWLLNTIEIEIKDTEIKGIDKK